MNDILLKNGYLSSLSNNVQDDCVNIVLGSVNKGSTERKRNAVNIMYNMEQFPSLEETNAHTQQNYARFKDIINSYDYILDSDQSNVEFLKHNGFQNAYYAPIGYHPRFEVGLSETPETLDLLFLGVLSGRRMKILEKLYKKYDGLALFNVFGEERAKKVMSAKINLNLHFDDNRRYFESHRIIMLMLCNKRFVLSEPVENCAPLIKDEHFVVTDQDNLDSVIGYYLKNEIERRQIGCSGYEYVKSHLRFSDTFMTAFDELGKSHKQVFSVPTQNRKTCAVYRVFNEEDYIEHSLKSIYNHVDNIVVFLGNKPWNGEAVKPDRTEEIIVNYPDIQNKIVVVKYDAGSINAAHPYSGEVKLSNTALNIIRKYFPEMGYVLLIDGDEVYEEKHITNLLKYAYTNTEDVSFYSRWYTYWKTPGFRIDPMEPYSPLVLFKPNSETLFTGPRVINDKERERNILNPEDVLVHHFSYAKPDDKIRQKILSFSHCREIVDGWYENVWRKWDEDNTLTNLHPTHPECYKHVVEVDIKNIPVFMADHPLINTDPYVYLGKGEK
ncbi:MAG: glycosyltransferase [Elusimicrobiota bacterium]